MHKQFSRKGAKTQWQNAEPSTSVPPLRLCEKVVFARKQELAVVISFLLLSWIPAPGQNKAARFDPDGSFWIIGDHPDGFSDFGGINLNAKRLRRLPSSGLQLIDGKTFRFKALRVKRDNFTFTTVTVGGVYYSFSGRFLRGGVFAATDLSDERPVLEGVLAKYQAGKKVAEGKLKFMYFGGT